MRGENATVLVMNGTRKADQGKAASELLREKDITAVGEGSADTVYGVSQFIVHTSKPYTIRYIMETLNIPNSRIKIAYDPNADVDIEFIVGNDWAGLEP
jgi:hypothetical protein